MRRARQTLKQTQWKFSGWQHSLIYLFICCLVGLAGLDYYLQVRVQRLGASLRGELPAKSLSREERLRLEIDRVLLAAGVLPSGIEENTLPRRVRVPAGVLVNEVYQQIVARALQLGAEVKGANAGLLPGEKELTCLLAGRVADAVRLQPTSHLNTGKIALVIDDFGYHDDLVIRQFCGLPFTITYAIIPGLPYSAALAQRLQRAQKAFIVHMPMEALERKVESNGYALMVDLPTEEIQRRVRKALAATPGAQGMNNHMGSRATQNEALLHATFEELKKSGMFFLDSRTSPETRAFTLAQKQGLAAGLNDTFLDTEETGEYIRKKLFHLAEVASARGTAIGIGHPHRITLQTLQEVLPQLQRRGFEFVPVENVIRAQPPQLSSALP